MKKLLSVLFVLSLVVVGLLATSGTAMASPHQGNYGEDFVCPVIVSEGISNNPVAKALGDTGAYTVVPATSQANHMNVPDQATNGGGTGTPGDPDQAAPGDTDYTAIWNGD